VSFFAPGFVALTLLAAIPVLIHLIGRRRARPRRFAAIDLLLRSEKRVARRTKLRQLLLLAVRALAIAAVPLILAKPFTEASSDLPAAVSGAQSAVLVVDDSLSMSLKVDDRTLLARAVERARKIVNALGGDADCALVLASRGGAAPVAELTADRTRLLRALDQVRPTYRQTDITGALKRAAQILQHATRADRRVYLISDLAAHGFDDAPPWAAGAGPELIPIDVADGARASNRAVVDLKIEPAAHLGPRGVRVSVEVASFGGAPVKDLPVTLRVDGKPVAKGLLDVDADARAVKRFFHTFGRGDEADIGVHTIEAALEPDALPDDDRRYARVEVHRDVRALVVDGDPRTVRREDEVFYLETALRPGDRDDSQLEVTAVTADELARRSLADYDVVFLCNVKAPADASALREFVEGGGGLFIALGENVDPDAYDEAFGALLPQPLATIRAEAGDGEHIARADRAHPMLQPLLPAAHPAEPFQAARFTRYALFKPTKDAERQVLLRFESGAPALLESRLGRGRVLVFASTIDRDWNDLAIQPIFLPLMQQATRWLARAPLHDAEAPVTVGQRHEIPLADGDVRVEVTRPSGKARAIDVAGRRTLAFNDTDEPGVYRVAVAAGDGTFKPRPAASFVVNVDAAESDPARIAPARLAQLSAGGGAHTTKPPRRRVELWHALGAGLLLLLLGEAVLLRRK
jgi:Aerotolerance regulator N-terminal/von Willebrand factor type A domain